MAVSINHAGHQHLARKVEPLSGGIGEGIDLRITADFEDFSVFHRHRLSQRLAGDTGENLAIGEYQIGCCHGLQ